MDWVKLILDFMTIFVGPIILVNSLKTKAYDNDFCYELHFKGWVICVNRLNNIIVVYINHSTLGDPKIFCK